MKPELGRRSIQYDLYQPSAYARYKKRLELKEFDPSEFDDLAHGLREADTEDSDIPPGFQRVMPRRLDPHSGMTAQRTSMYVGLPISLWPQCFESTKFVDSVTVMSMELGTKILIMAASKKSFTIVEAMRAPTISQWSGEEMVVNFGALRKLTR